MASPQQNSTNDLELHFTPMLDSKDILIEYIGKHSRVVLGELLLNTWGQYEFSPRLTFRLNASEMRQIAEKMESYDRGNTP